MAAEGGFGPTKDTGSGEIVSILLTGSDPHALKLKADRDGCAACIVAFERANGKFGTIQRHGGVHPGDILFCINDTLLENMPHGDVIVMLNDRTLLRKNLKFMSSNEYYRRKKKNVSSMSRADNSAAARQSFVSKVKRARVVDVGAGNSSKYSEYEVTCQWKVVAGLEKEKTLQWSVWKRFSEFEALQAQLKKSLGWQIDHVEFPPSHTLTMNKYTPEFIEKRREALNTYWQGICAVAKVMEFDKHHCSAEIKKFLDVDSAAALSEQSTPSSTYSAGDEESNNSRPAPTRRMSQKGVSSRRLSSKNMAGALNYEDGGSSGSITSTPKPSAASSSAAAASASATATASAPASAPRSPPPAAAPPAPAAAPAAPMSATMSENIGKYNKMKAMLPEGAVRQRMGADGCTEAEIDAFFGGGGDAPPPPAAAAAPASRPPPAAAAAAAPAAKPSPVAAAPPASSAPPPPKTQGRANLLASIAARRID